MRIVELKNGNVKLVAEEGRVIQSRAEHYDEELEGEVADVKGAVVYLGRNDMAENYVEIEKEEV